VCVDCSSTDYSIFENNLCSIQQKPCAVLACFSHIVQFEQFTFTVMRDRTTLFIEFYYICPVCS